MGAEMIDALIAGKLFGAPQRRTSKNGNDFVTGKMRAPGSDGQPLFITFIAFRDHVCATLLALADGSSIAIAGEMKLSTYEAKDKSHRVSIDVTVHEILTTAHISRRRQAIKDEAPSRPQSSPATSNSTAVQEDFNDEIPF
jgi:single-stranded DNA-binding protein